MLTPQRKKRKLRVRAKVFGTHQKPRLSVFRSNKFVYAQLIDDEKGHTLASFHSADAKVVGAKIAAMASLKKIKTTVFDRSGYRYHGKIKTLVESARKEGLKI